MDAVKLALQAARDRDDKLRQQEKIEAAARDRERKFYEELCQTMHSVVNEFQQVKGLTVQNERESSVELYKDGKVVMRAEVGLYTYTNPNYECPVEETEPRINVDFIRPDDYSNRPCEVGHYSCQAFRIEFPKRFGQLFL